MSAPVLEVRLCACGCGGSVPPDKRGRVRRWLMNHDKRVSLDGSYAVDSDTGCWNWLRGVLPNGYGHLRDYERGTTVYAHRFMYERANGSIPEGLWLDHLCRNRRCCNPAHLEVVTPAENIHRGKATKLSPADVKAIRAEWNALVSSMAARYGVTPGHIKDVARERRRNG